MSKPLVFFDSTDAIRGAEASEADRSATWKDFLHILKMGIVFSNLITTFAGLWLALDETGQSFFDHIGTVIAALVGSGLVMAGGCALNNFIDRDIDQLMERTKDRPSATGQLTARQVFWTGIIMSTLGTIVLIQASYTAAVLGLVGLFVYVVVYTLWLKRTHSINTIVGGISGAIPPVIGWAAIDPGLVSLTPWLLFLIVFLWQPPHFLALAIKRVDEYRRAGVPMLPVVAGMNMTKRQMIFYVVLLLPASLMLYELGPLYLTFAVLLGIGWIAVAVAGLFTKDVMKWSKRMFVYSLNYLTILFIVMVVSVL